MAPAPAAAPVLRPPRRDELHAVADLLGAAMADNPNHAAYGARASVRARRHALLMRALLATRPSAAHLGAFAGDEVVGFVSAVPSPGCRPGPGEVARLAPALVRLGPTGLVRVLAWQRSWERHHPAHPHLHVGPLAVHRDWRGHGVGRRLLELALSHRGDGPPAYLETDREVNVGFYEAAGFRVRSEGTVLGRRNWFMEQGAPPAR